MMDTRLINSSHFVYHSPRFMSPTQNFIGKPGCAGSAGSRERRPYSTERMRASTLYSSGDQRLISLKNLKDFIEEVYDAKFKHDQDTSVP